MEPLWNNEDLMPELPAALPPELALPFTEPPSVHFVRRADRNGLSYACPCDGCVQTMSTAREEVWRSHFDAARHPILCESYPQLTYNQRALYDCIYEYRCNAAHLERVLSHMLGATLRRQELQELIDAGGMYLTTADSDSEPRVPTSGDVVAVRRSLSSRMARYSRVGELIDLELVLPPLPAHIEIESCRLCNEPFATYGATSCGETVRLCQGCAVSRSHTCSHCVSRTLDHTITDDGHILCDHCVEMTPRCRQCGGLFANGMTHLSGGRGAQREYAGLCDECAAENGCTCVFCRPPRRTINHYGYRPRLVFHDDDGSTFRGASRSAGRTFLGLELEVGFDQSYDDDDDDYPPHVELMRAAEATQEVLGALGYLKEDSSISGFEMVIHPMTHQYAMNHFPWEVLRTMARNSCIEDDDAGIHVHVNRSAFDSPSHIYRWMKLIYRNSDAVEVIARRSGSSWARFSRLHRRSQKDYAKGEMGGERYSAINVTNTATFEVRVFATSLDEREVKAALDLVAASVEYTRNLTVPAILDGGWQWEGFITWAEADGRYPSLVAMSEERGIGAPDPVHNSIGE